MTSSYLFGFALTMMIGARWEKLNPKQLPNALFMAIGFAAVISVWLQFSTWLDLLDGGLTDIWSMGLSGERPYANLGQPNNLATLLVWGVLACCWAYLAKLFTGASAVFIAIFLLLGLALTQSRMGMLAITALLCAAWFWRHLWPSYKLPWVASGLYGFFWVTPFLLKLMHTTLFPGSEGSFLRLQQQGELRLSAWQLFLHAVAESPWLGYGWTGLGGVYLAVADKAPGLGVTFAHSHNLFLDLVLWLGMPLGLLISGLLLHWFWKKFRAVDNANDAVLFLVVGIVGIHAMVELPLHYAYFLLPTGLFIGVINARMGARVIWTTPRWTLAALWLTATLALGAIIHDYFRVEASYNTLRFEQARIGLGKNPVGKPPDVLVLTEFREWIRLARFEVRAGMSHEELDWMSSVTRAYPSATAVYRLAVALALNDQPDEALILLKKICKITHDVQCRKIQQAWQHESTRDPRRAAVKWPL